MTIDLPSGEICGSATRTIFATCGISKWFAASAIAQPSRARAVILSSFIGRGPLERSYTCLVGRMCNNAPKFAPQGFRCGGDRRRPGWVHSGAAACLVGLFRSARGTRGARTPARGDVAAEHSTPFSTVGHLHGSAGRGFLPDVGERRALGYGSSADRGLS